MKKIDINFLENIHIELSSYCNGKCPLCRRHDTEYADRVNYHLSQKAIDNLLIPKLVKRLKYIALCGNFGEPTLSPNLYYFIDKLYSINSEVNIWISTNGATYDVPWWGEFGRYSKDNKIEVCFCLDGLDDESNKYRGTSFKKVMSHMTSYIYNGGRVEWRVVPFLHNQHCIENIRKLCKQMDIKFTLKKSWYYTKKYKKPTIYIDHTKESFNNKCLLLHNKLFYVDARGYVDPCCYLVKSFNDFTHLSLDDYNIEEIINSKYFNMLLLFVNKYNYCKNYCGECE